MNLINEQAVQLEIKQAVEEHLKRDQVPVNIVSIEKFAEITGQSKGAVTTQVDRGLLPIHKVGSKRFINLLKLNEELREGF